MTSDTNNCKDCGWRRRGFFGAYCACPAIAKGRRPGLKKARTRTLRSFNRDISYMLGNCTFWQMEGASQKKLIFFQSFFKKAVH